jgi:glycosyltransferase involved in cell wall biosynthesis
MISVILTIKNRAHLLKWSLQSLIWNLNRFDLISEILIADGGSTDDLDEVINGYYPNVKKWTLDRTTSPYNHVSNCPSWEYNFLVSKATNDVIIKIDPEVCIITSTFIERGLALLEEYKDAMLIPFCYHCWEFPIGKLADIKENYLNHYYETHLKEAEVNRGECRLVYYAAMFRRQSFIDLGGIDMRFVEGIGSEDDHFLDQWERKYGNGSIISTTEEKCVHLWHGEWGHKVPSEHAPLIMKNRILRDNLKWIYPNDGDFNKIKYE